MRPSLLGVIGGEGDPEELDGEDEGADEAVVVTETGGESIIKSTTGSTFQRTLATSTADLKFGESEQVPPYSAAATCSPILFAVREWRKKNHI